MESLFATDCIPIDLPDANLLYFPNFFDKEQADLIFEELLNSIPWQQDDLTVFGKKYQQPRLTALFGNDGKAYSYSTITMQPHPWTTLLQKIKVRIETATNTKYTAVLLNLYRDGKDSNGWHADNEKELGKNPVIASLSFGATRTFHLQHNTDKSLKQKILLTHGSLLIMAGTTQHFWKHQIPKTAKPIEPRINLTFRELK
jgi:alkylated DNA repair dioxygenase AlkB